MEVLLYIYIYTLTTIIYEPFGLGRFATDHSLTKAASRPLFARVRRYALQRDNQKITFEISMLDYPFGYWNQVNPKIFEICYFMKTSTINIHMRKF